MLARVASAAVRELRGDRRQKAAGEGGDALDSYRSASTAAASAANGSYIAVHIPQLRSVAVLARLIQTRNRDLKLRDN